MRLPLAAVLLALALALVSASTVAADDAAATAGAPDYATRVAPILKTYCVGCHNDGDREGEFSLESYQSLRKGTPHGPAVVAGKAANSRIIRQLTGAAKPSMPPKGEPKPSAAEVEVLRAWVDAGAVGPLGAPADRLALVVPQIESRSTTRPITALDASRDGKWIAVARFGTVALHAGTPEGPLPTDEPRRVLTDFPGKVTAVHFTADGARLVTASGVAGRSSV